MNKQKQLLTTIEVDDLLQSSIPKEDVDSVTNETTQIFKNQKGFIKSKAVLSKNKVYFKIYLYFDSPENGKNALDKVHGTKIFGQTVKYLPGTFLKDETVTKSNENTEKKKLEKVKSTKVQKEVIVENSEEESEEETTPSKKPERPSFIGSLGPITGEKKGKKTEKKIQDASSGEEESKSQKTPKKKTQKNTEKIEKERKKPEKDGKDRKKPNKVLNEEIQESSEDEVFVQTPKKDKPKKPKQKVEKKDGPRVRKINLYSYNEKVYKKYQQVFEKKLNVKFMFEKSKLSLQGVHDDCYKAFGYLTKDLFVKKKLPKDDDNYARKFVAKWTNIKVESNIKNNVALIEKLEKLGSESLGLYEIKTGKISCIGSSSYLDQAQQIIKEETQGLFQRIFGSLSSNQKLIEESDSSDESDTSQSTDLSGNDSEYSEKEEEESEEEITIQKEITKKHIVVKYAGYKSFKDLFEKYISNVKNATIQIQKPKFSKKPFQDMKFFVSAKDSNTLSLIEKELKSLLSVEELSIPQDHFTFFVRRLLPPKKEDPKKNPKFIKKRVQRPEDSILKEIQARFPKTVFYIDVDKKNSKVFIVTENQLATLRMKKLIQEKISKIEKTKKLIPPTKEISKFLKEQFQNESFITKYDLKGIKIKFEKNEAEISGPVVVIDRALSLYETIVWAHHLETKKYFVDSTNEGYIKRQINSMKLSEISVYITKNTQDDSLEVSFFALDPQDMQKTQDDVEKIIKESITEKYEIANVSRDKIAENIKVIDQEFSNISFFMPEPPKGKVFSKVLVLINGNDKTEIQAAKDRLDDLLKGSKGSIQVTFPDKYILEEFKSSLLMSLKSDVKVSIKGFNVFLNGATDKTKIGKEKILKFIKEKIQGSSVQCKEFTLEYRKLLLSTLKRDFFEIGKKTQCRIELYDNLLTYAKVGNCMVNLLVGDITESYCDVIVNPANVDLNHEGGLARIIRDKGGDIIDRECTEWLKKNTLKVGECMMTNSGNLNCLKIIHTVGPIYQGINQDKKDLENSVINALNMADENMFQTIAIPAISTGIYVYPMDQATQIITSTVLKHSQHLKHIKSICFYAKDSPAIWKNHMLFILKSKNLNQGITITEQPKNYSLWYYIDDDNSWKAYSNSINSKIQSNFEKSIFDFQLDISNNTYRFDLKKGTQTQIKTNYQRKCTNNLPNQPSYQWKWEDDNSQFTPYNIDQNKKIEEAYQKDLNSNRSQDLSLTITRHNDDQLANYEFNFAQMIQINKSTKYKRKLKRDILMKSVDFTMDEEDIDTIIPMCYVEAIGKDPKKCIQLLEELEKKNLKKFEINGNLPSSFITQLMKDTKCKITCSSDKIICEGYFNQVDDAILKMKVELINSNSFTQKIEYPKEWKSTSDFNMSKLDPNSQEFKDIANNMFKTHQCKIVQIERIENKTLYKTFYNRKKDMKNPNSKFLFHGTSSFDPKLIYSSSVGFDFRRSRSSCLWGVGAYFAVNASYSCSGYHYTIPGTRQKQVFYVEVLVGDETSLPQDSNIRCPPCKTINGQLTNIEYDSVTGVTGNSQVYIIYRNDSSYPSYLITFE